jgi:hypothetical protein
MYAHARALRSLVGLAVLLVAPSARAFCAQNCSLQNIDTICLKVSFQCISLPFGGGYCAPYSIQYGAIGMACEPDADPCTADVCGSTTDGNGMTVPSGQCTHVPNGGFVCSGACYQSGCCDNPNSCAAGFVCNGPGGACVCPGGQYACGSSCIPNGTCCDNPNNCGGGMACPGAGGSCNCPAATPRDCGGTCYAGQCCVNGDCPQPSGPGTGTCSAPGGTCSMQCSGGYKLCGTSCIPVGNCCVDDDCPDDAANRKHGVCNGGSCGLACDTGYPKACGLTCIPQGQCCTSSECTTPPSGCYVVAGTCVAGTCQYALNNGAACNADGTKCTPNDRCMNGTCVADTANLVKCVRRPCHTAPACNPATGNCEDSVVGGACGGDGCTLSGTCSGGVCSGATKDCSSLGGPCATGICDPAIADTSANCTTVNVLNGTPCAASDKCQLQAECSGGACIGTPKVCESSDPCRAASCDPATGECVENQVPAGTACSMVEPDGCQAAASCDSAGTCVPSSVPDGTPCVAQDCLATGVCVTGACICAGAPDLGISVGMEQGGPPPPSDGCALPASPVTASAPLTLLVLAGLARALRRRR